MAGSSTPERPRLASARRPRFRRLLDSVSARLVAIILFSVVPLAAIGSLMAWNNYQATLDASSMRAGVVAQTLRAHTDQQLADTEHMLRALATQPELTARSDCAELLRLSRSLQSVPLSVLDLYDKSGNAVCHPGGAPIAMPSSGSQTMSIAGGDQATRRPIMRISVAATGPDGPAFLVADMLLGWDMAQVDQLDLWHSRLGHNGNTQAWLVLPDGRNVPFCNDCAWSSNDTAKGAGTSKAAPGPAGGGHFLLPHLAGSIGLLVVTTPSAEESQALSTFIWRVIAIALLLALGLLAVAVGASLLIVAPLRSITRSVTEWRRVGNYDPRHTRLTPFELRQLSRAFSQATRALAAHEDRLRKAEAKQELLIKEIHHRVKNNLQIIASLLNLQANRIRQPEARAEFASARDRVRALATLHRHLYSEGELHTLNMRSFLHELCGQLFQAIGEKEGRRIQLEIEAPDIVMSTDQAVPLALVVTEAVSNAIKYAFPGGRSGRVSVRLAEEVEGIATLVIQDDGIGIPAGRAETETGIRDGLGIQLIRGFARQLGATLEVLEGDEPGEGTRYTLLVPLHPQVQHAEDADETVGA